MTVQPSIFDILGPIMIGPSSSHTAGASRIGYVARQLLKANPARAVITLYNSFARTHKGHGTDRAIIGGILGYGPDDERIRDSFELGRSAGLEWEFKFQGDQVRYHSHAARVRLIDSAGKDVEIVGASLGGGRISILEIQGFPVNFNAQTFTLVVIADDVPGSIQQISGAISHKGINIANMFVSRRGRTANMVIELDHTVEPETLRVIEAFSWVQFVRLVEPMLQGSSQYEK